MENADQTTEGVETLRVNDFHIEKRPDGSVHIWEDAAARSTQRRRTMVVYAVFVVATLFIFSRAGKDGNFLPLTMNHVVLFLILAGLLAYFLVEFLVLRPRRFLRRLVINSDSITAEYGKDSTATGFWTDLLRVDFIFNRFHFADGSVIKLPRCVFYQNYVEMVFASTPIRDQLLGIVNQNIRLSYWLLPIPILIAVSYFMIALLLGREVYRENKFVIRLVYFVVAWGLVVAIYAFRYAWDKRHSVIRLQEPPDHE